MHSNYPEQQYDWLNFARLIEIPIVIKSLVRNHTNRFYDQSSQAVTTEYESGSRKDGNADSNGADSVASPQRIIIILSLFIPTHPSIGIL